ncbi:MAG: PilZ domain-containing protein [Pirellulaceae bacterium]|nr:PilZ domain-containing protein [Pirellulaceae bacterium]
MDRRGAPRLALAAEAVGQWELSTEGFPLSVSDVSAAGIGVVIDKPCEVGQRLRISFDGETQDADTITAKTVRQREVAGQYLVGCTILKGAPYLFLNRSVEMKCRQAVRKNRVYLGTLCIRIVDIYILATNFCLRWNGL